MISQTRRLVSQERLSPRAGTSVFIDLIPITPSGEQWFELLFTAGVSHHTPPLIRGCLYQQTIFDILNNFTIINKTENSTISLFCWL